MLTLPGSVSISIISTQTHNSILVLNDSYDIYALYYIEPAYKTIFRDIYLMCMYTITPHRNMFSDIYAYNIYIVYIEPAYYICYHTLGIYAQMSVIYKHLENITSIPPGSFSTNNLDNYTLQFDMGKCECIHYTSLLL